MAFLTIEGIDVPVDMNSARKRNPFYIPQDFRGSVRGPNRSWKLQTTPMTQEDIDALISVLQSTTFALCSGDLIGGVRWCFVSSSIRPFLQGSILSSLKVLILGIEEVSEFSPEAEDTRPFGLVHSFQSTNWVPNNDSFATWTLGGGATITPGQSLRDSSLFNRCSTGTISIALPALTGVLVGSNLVTSVLWKKDTSRVGMRLRIRDTALGVDRLSIAWDSDITGRPINIVKSIGSSLYSFIPLGDGLYKLYIWGPGFIAANTHEIILEAGNGLSYFAVPVLQQGKFPGLPIINTTAAARIEFGDALVKFVGSSILGAGDIGWMGAKQKLWMLEDPQDDFQPSLGFLPAVTGNTARCMQRPVIGNAFLHFRESPTSSGAGTPGVVLVDAIRNRRAAFVVRFDGVNQYAYAGGVLNRQHAGFGGVALTVYNEYDIQCAFGLTYSYACYNVDLGEAEAIAADISGVNVWPEHPNRTAFHDLTTRTIPVGGGNISSSDRLGENYLIVPGGTPRFARGYY